MFTSMCGQYMFTSMCGQYMFTSMCGQYMFTSMRTVHVHIYVRTVPGKQCVSTNGEPFVCMIDVNKMGNRFSEIKKSSNTLTEDNEIVDTSNTSSNNKTDEQAKTTSSSNKTDASNTTNTSKETSSNTTTESSSNVQTPMFTSTNSSSSTSTGAPSLIPGSVSTNTASASNANTSAPSSVTDAPSIADAPSVSSESNTPSDEIVINETLTFTRKADTSAKTKCDENQEFNNADKGSPYTFSSKVLACMYATNISVDSILVDTTKPPKREANNPNKGEPDTNIKIYIGAGEPEKRTTTTEYEIIYPYDAEFKYLDTMTYKKLPASITSEFMINSIPIPLEAGTTFLDDLCYYRAKTMNTLIMKPNTRVTFWCKGGNTFTFIANSTVDSSKQSDSLAVESNIDSQDIIYKPYSKLVTYRPKNHNNYVVDYMSYFGVFYELYPTQTTINGNVIYLPKAKPCISLNGRKLCEEACLKINGKKECEPIMCVFDLKQEGVKDVYKIVVSKLDDEEHKQVIFRDDEFKNDKVETFIHNTSTKTSMQCRNKLILTLVITILIIIVLLWFMFVFKFKWYDDDVRVARPVGRH